MSNERARRQALADIRASIDGAGLHIYCVGMGKLPKYCYTIGLSDGALDAELVLAGAARFAIDEVADALNDLGDAARAGEVDPSGSSEAAQLGEVHFQEVHPSWMERLLLGALDYYAPRPVRAYQVLLRPELITLDVPDLSREWDPDVERVWRWLDVPWSHAIPEDTAVVTNFRALRGHPITEVSHWEDDAWELVAADDAPMAKSELAVVPMATLLAVDPALEEVLSLPLGRAMRRDDPSAAWEPWGD
jgi:hypothetical protein